MDTELLAAIVESLDKKLDEKLDQKIDPIRQGLTRLQEDVTGLDGRITGLQKQGDIIARYVSETRADVRDIKGSLFNVESEVTELHRGQQIIETRLDRVEADVKVIGDMSRDHETLIREMRRKALGK